MTDNKYNGWTNFETWVVSLWLDNEKASYDYWREEANHHRREAPNCSQVIEGIWTAEEAAKINLAGELKEEITDGTPVTSQTSVYSDLLNAALAEVNWYEIAENMLIDLPDIISPRRNQADGEES